MSYDDMLCVKSMNITMRRARWEKVLCELMSEVSESLWAAGWLIDLEYLLPTLNEHHRKFAPKGLYESTVEIANVLGYWVDMDGRPVEQETK